MAGFSAHCISTIIRVNSAFKTDAECQGLPTQKHKLFFLDKKAFAGTWLQDNSFPLEIQPYIIASIREYKELDSDEISCS